MTDTSSPLGLLSFLTFGISVIAAVLAIDMYKLLRTGDFGKTWRLLIIACVMFALLQVLRLADILNFPAITITHLSEIVELCFAIVMAFAFYHQRSLFSRQSKASGEGAANEWEVDGDDVLVDEDEEGEAVHDLQRAPWPQVGSSHDDSQP